MQIQSRSFTELIKLDRKADSTTATETSPPSAHQKKNLGQMGLIEPDAEQQLQVWGLDLKTTLTTDKTLVHEAY